MIESLNHLSPSEYRAFSAVSQSDLKAAYDNPQLYHERWPRASSESQEWGTAFENFLRGGEVQAMQVIPASALAANGHRRGKAWEAYRDSVPEGTLLVTQKEYDELYGGWERAAENVRGHEMANRLIYAQWNEWSQRFTWDCELTGMKLKGEMDMLNAPLECITDVKTAADVDHHSFQRSVIKFGYDIQAAMYLRAASLLLCDVEWSYAWVVVRNVPPYNVEVYEASADLLEYGSKRLDQRLRFFHECRISGRWVTPTHGIVQTLYPPHYLREMV